MASAFVQHVDDVDIQFAARNLAASGVGRRALEQVADILDGPALDGRNQKAVLTLLCGGFGALAGTTRDAIRAEINR